MWKRIGYGKENFPYNYSEFLCDSESDIANLPTSKKDSDAEDGIIPNCSPGSKAIVVETKKVYILNNADEWVYLYDCGGNGGGGGTISVDVATPEETKTFLDI